MKRVLLAFIPLFLAALTLPAAAAESPAGGPAVTFSASDLTLEEAAASLSRSAGIPVVADPASAARISASFTSTPVEQVLDALGKMANIEWQKVFVPTATGAQSLTKEALARARQQAGILKQLVSAPKAEDAAEAIPASTTVVYDPASKAQITVTVQPADSGKASIAAATLGLKPVYVLIPKDPATAPKDGSASAAGVQGYASLSKQQSQQFLQLSPQERVQAIQESMSNDLTMSPAELAQMTQARMEAYHTLMQSDSAVVQRWRQQRRDAWETLRQSGAIPDFGRGRGGDRGDRGGMMGPGF